MEKEAVGLEYTDVTELVEGSKIFESHGFSMLKVTNGEEIITKRLPIKSSGISELIDSFTRKNSPIPPEMAKVVHPESELGKELKLRKSTTVKMFDLTDEGYLDEKEKFESRLGLKIVLMGLDLQFKDKDGNEITDEDKKIEILEGQGLSSEHFSQIVKDIRMLTQWEDEKEDDFLQQ